MHIKVMIAVLLCGVVLSASSATAYDPQEARELFEKKCSVCHSISDYDMGDRSIKEWQLVVERMSSYGGANPYTDDEADDIITYLYSVKPDTSLAAADLYEYEQPSAASATDTQPATAPAKASRPKFRVSWRKSKATGVAKIMGHFATALMALIIVSGLARKKLKANFMSVHIAMAILLFGALSIHVSVYLCEYGAPNVLWLWFGILAAVLIGLVEFGGLMRRRLGAKFIRWHSVCGVVGFVLVLLHWFWIYLP